MTELSPDYFSKPVSEVDPEIAQVLDDELRRQETTLEMIASENFVPQAVLDCQGSVLTNKYAEGYPGKRYYGGCEHVDVAEELAIARAKQVFGAEHVNVQPHAGAQANAAAFHALLQAGDRILGMKLDHGGHLTHGMKINFSGRLYDIVAYGVSDKDSRVDMDVLERLAQEFRPKLILAGWSAYSRQLDFRRFREIADSIGAYLMVDMAHFAGLVAAGEHPSPVPHADVVTTTVHKTLGGPRSGMILAREEHARKIDSAVFPGQQGGPLMHVVAAKAVALKIAQSELFRERQRRTRAGAAAIAAELTAAGVDVLTGGTDVHLVLVDLRDSALDGQQGEDRLHAIGITVNRNSVPNDPRPPAVSSGLRIGTPALATRGFQLEDFQEVGKIIATALTEDFTDDVRADLSERTRALAERYPLYPELGKPVATV
ncbi:MAG TPA: serine hydroxymethyltransferase [Thermoleophilaceae bacterium]|nr:serine hydroxymethyltransferase [Thermoleophilaceae bacterium]